MNSKAEFNRCHIPRLVVEEEDQDQESRRLKEEDIKRQDMEQLLNGMDKSWEQRKTLEKEQAAKKRRLSEGELEQKSKRRRKLKHPVLEENWGAMETIVEEPCGEQEQGCCRASHQCD